MKNWPFAMSMSQWHYEAAAYEARIQCEEATNEAFIKGIEFEWIDFRYCV